MKYRYSRSLGLIKDNKCVDARNYDDWFYTEDEAYIDYYKKQRTKFLKVINERKRKLNIIQADLHKLTTEFQLIINKYPEEFI